MDIKTDQTYHWRDRICERFYSALYAHPIDSHFTALVDPV